jgi:hypothetical protein
MAIDPNRSSVGSRNTGSFITARASLPGLQAARGQAIPGDDTRPQSMASLSLTMPPEPSRRPHSVQLPDGDILRGSSIEAGEEPAGRPTEYLSARSRAPTMDQSMAPGVREEVANISIRSDSIQQGLQAAERVGVKAAKLNFWSRLVGATLAGLGVVAFGVLTGGVGVLAISGLIASGLYFVKASADVHMSRLHLQNARAIQAGQDPPHDLPCGPDAMAHFIFRQKEKRINQAAPSAERDAARAKAIASATYFSMGTDLVLGLSSVAISGIAFDKIAVSLSSFTVRLAGSLLSRNLSSTNPTRYSQESIDLANKDLNDLYQVIAEIQPLPPEDVSDPVRLHHYQNQVEHLDGLREEFASVRAKFEQSLNDYNAGLESISPSARSESRLANAAAVSAGMDATDFVEVAAYGQSYYLGTLATVGATGAHSALSMGSLNAQQRLENALTAALLEMNEGLKNIARHAVQVRAMAPSV